MNPYISECNCTLECIFTHVCVYVHLGKNVSVSTPWNVSKRVSECICALKSISSHQPSIVCDSSGSVPSVCVCCLEALCAFRLKSLYRSCAYTDVERSVCLVNVLRTWNKTVSGWIDNTGGVCFCCWVFFFSFAGEIWVIRIFCFASLSTAVERIPRPLLLNGNNYATCCFDARGIWIAAFTIPVPFLFFDKRALVLMLMPLVYFI